MWERVEYNINLIFLCVILHIVLYCKQLLLYISASSSFLIYKLEYSIEHSVKYSVEYLKESKEIFIRSLRIFHGIS